MGKYMRKSKTATVDDKPPSALVDHLSQSSLGVLTRAKTLALQRLHNSAGSYLQLRNRRLQKPQLTSDSRRQSQLSKQSRGPNPNPSLIANPNSPPSLNCRVPTDDEIEENKSEGDCLPVEASFGDNVLEFEGRTSTRESTPCSLIKNPEAVRTPPGSTNRRNSNGTSSVKTSLPTSKDINDFFTAAEQLHHKQFMDKYNFDPVKGTPLVGRYEWIKVNP